MAVESCGLRCIRDLLLKEEIVLGITHASSFDPEDIVLLVRLYALASQCRIEHGGVFTRKHIRRSIVNSDGPPGLLQRLHGIAMHLLAKLIIIDIIELPGGPHGYVLISRHVL